MLDKLYMLLHGRLLTNYNITLNRTIQKSLSVHDDRVWTIGYIPPTLVGY